MNIITWHKNKIIEYRQFARRSSGIMRSTYSDMILYHKKELAMRVEKGEFEISANESPCFIND